MSLVCRNTESAVINAKTSELWSVIRRLNFVDIMPSIVKNCSLLIPKDSIQVSPLSPRSKVIKLEDVEYQDASISTQANPFTCAVAVGSLRHVVYKDGAEFVFRIVEVSDLLHQISYELIETDATVNVSSVLHTIQLHEITQSGQTFLCWTTEFSGDCSNKSRPRNEYTDD